MQEKWICPRITRLHFGYGEAGANSREKMRKRESH
jgi:hypothetical protein